MTTDLARIASDPSALEAAADPGKFVVQACERAKAWLVEALEHGDIDQIVELKSQAEAIRVYTMSKQLGEDARLSATEIVRRAERGIGVAIRRGQESGQIAKRGDRIAKRGDPNLQTLEITKVSTLAAAKVSHPSELEPMYAMADGVTDEQFEAALADAKAEGNLSRANVVRKVQGVEPTEQPKTPIPGRKRRPITDAFREAAYDLAKTVERIERLLDDDRYPRHAEQVTALIRNDLLRVSGQLTNAISRMAANKEGSK